MLKDLKEQVCQANLDLVEAGLVTLTWGNVSGLSDDGTRVVIKPSGVSYDSMKPKQMVVLDLETGDKVDGDLKPSSDTATHLLLYRAWGEKGIHGITHTHSPKATAFAQARREIPCFGTTHADHFSGTIPVARMLTQEEIEEAYEANTGHAILQRFADLDPVAMPAVLLASHAPFTWGKSPAESVKNSIALEACAAMALDALTLRPDLGPVEDYLLEKHYSRKHGPGAYYGQK